ncbi:hypothetical protein A5791_15725 [Mycobacterium sp. 852002-51163_SCH5372311]|nr:hypothetical protein A5791_15725 [Mycobacterium sp. 852002-51163_SCH5372311]
MGFLDRILRARQVMASKLNFRVINRFLENVAVHFEKGNSKRFGFAHHLNDRALKQTRIYPALDSKKLAHLPPRSKAICFLRKPDV